MPPRTLIIAGLGPGDASLLTVEARALFEGAQEVWLRTARHPTVAGLPAGPRYESFDDVYESGASFEEVYERIVGKLLELAARDDGVIYAVPGHPLVGEATTRGLFGRAPAAGIDVRIVPGLSFLDSVVAALGFDPLAQGLLVLDALAFAPHRRLLAPQRPTVIAQVYDRRAASAVKLALLEAYPPEHVLRVVTAAGTADATIRDTPVVELDRSDGFDHLTVVYAPPLPQIADVRSFEGLRAIVAQLRAPDGGCPWDLEQTHDSLKRYLIEEAYEALEALDEGEPKRLAEEMGDLMMQVLLHAQIAEDNGEFTIEDVMRSIAEKLVRRHPHVFGEVEVEGAQEVLRNWETLKKQERGDAPLLDAVPKSLPALAQAQSVQSRASKAQLGPEPLSVDGIVQVLRALADGTATPERVGDVLFAIVSLARERDVDAEEALRQAIGRYRDRVAEAERAETR